MSIRVSTFVWLSLICPGVTVAQTITGPIAAGVCAVKVSLAAPAAGQTTVELQLNKKAVTTVDVPTGESTVTITLRGPLLAGDELRATRVVGGKADAAPGPALIVGAGDGTVQCVAPKSNDVLGDERDTFDASGYVGTAVDNFAPASVGGYADSEQGGRHTRVVGGFDFEFRMFGSRESKRQFWVFGETMHGVRSADINCADPDNKPAVCDKLTVGPTGNAGKQLQFVLDNATSMEAFAGFRYEFMTLQVGDETPAKLYATARFGVMLLNGTARSAAATTTGGAPVAAQEFEANHAYRAHHVGTGLLLPSGKFSGSQLEVGWGVTELFNHAGVKGGWRRLKIDGALSVQLAGPMYGFVQLYADFDPYGPGADSVQTFYGVSFNIGEFFR